jgi:heme oxygenase (biliverdin-IX-beta and delta-forming)
MGLKTCNDATGGLPAADCQIREIANTAGLLEPNAPAAGSRSLSCSNRELTRTRAVQTKWQEEMVRVSVQSVATATPSIVALLRSRTQDAHSALEAQLGLLDQPASTEHFAHLLLRFFGFHLVWEKDLQAFPALAHELKGRSRLQHLRHDLKILGVTDADIDSVPLCGDAHRVAKDEASALGSFYVLEGSTLGGQVITKHLSGAGWLPAEGLSYFNPYGARTGVMWRSFKGWLDVQAEHHAANDIVAGARATFVVLQHWLSEGAAPHRRLVARL